MNKNNTKTLKRQTKKLLTEKGLRLWNTIFWDKEEVGNSEIGFLNLDPHTQPEVIANFINRKAKKHIEG